jgi:hypothetical protein
MASFAEPNSILSVKHVQQPGNTHGGELPASRPPDDRTGRAALRVRTSLGVLVYGGSYG